MTSKKSSGKSKKTLLRKEYAQPQRKYTLSLDDDAALKQKGDVDFVMELKPDTDPNTVRSKLEQIAEGKIGYANYMPNIGYLVCVTDMETYQVLFGTFLQKVAKKDQEIRKRYTGCGYRETSAAAIPPDLRDEVAKIFLNYVNG